MGDNGLRYVARVDPEFPVESRHDSSPNIFRKDAVEEKQPVQAAGVMHVTDDGRVLMMRRTDSGLWAFPGGHVEEGETARQAAARETHEETGVEVDEEDLVPWTRRIADGVDFTTFIHRCGEPFEPTLNHEHDEHSWEQWGDYTGDSLARVTGALPTDEIVSYKDSKSSQIDVALSRLRSFRVDAALRDLLGL